MTLHKIVNGVKIFLTPEEETAQRAKWAAQVQKKAEREATSGYIKKRRRAYPTTHEQLEAILAALKKLQSDGAALDPLTEELLVKIEDVNTTYPGPT